MKKITFRDQVKNYLHENGLKQRWFCQKVGLSEYEISRWLNRYLEIDQETKSTIQQYMDTH